MNKLLLSAAAVALLAGPASAVSVLTNLDPQPTTNFVDETPSLFFIYSGINQNDGPESNTYTLGVDALAFPFGGTIFVDGSTTGQSGSTAAPESALFDLGGTTFDLSDGSGNANLPQPITGSVFVPAGGTVDLTISFLNYSDTTPAGISVDNIFLVPADPAEIPLPASLPLLLAGLAGLGFMGARKRG